MTRPLRGGGGGSTTPGTGTVGSAQIIDGSIVDADINSSAAIAQSKVSGLVTALAGKLAATNNLSDVTASTARTNLGLGSVATLAAGGASGAATLDSGSKLTRSQLPSIGGVRNDLESGSYWVIPVGGATQSAAMAANRAYAVAFVLSAGATLGDLGLDCTAVATGGNVRAGLYASSSGRPGALITDYGTQVAPTGGVAMMWWAPTDVLTAGVEYYAVVVAQGLTGSPTFRQRNTNPPELSLGTSRPSSLAGSLSAYYSDTGFSGALPGTFGAVAGSIAGPCIVLKA